MEVPAKITNKNRHILNIEWFFSVEKPVFLFNSIAVLLNYHEFNI